MAMQKTSPTLVNHQIDRTVVGFDGKKGPLPFCLANALRAAKVLIVDYPDVEGCHCIKNVC